MVTELTQDEILNDYPKLKSINNLFESDILILPDIKPAGAFLYPLRLDMKKEYDNLKINFYSENQIKLRYLSTDSITDITEAIYLGAAVVSTIYGLIAIGEYVKKTISYKNNSTINIHIYNKTENNTYIYNNYNGNAHDFCNHELEKMKDDFNYK